MRFINELFPNISLCVAMFLILYVGTNYVIGCEKENAASGVDIDIEEGKNMAHWSQNKSLLSNIPHLG